MAFALKPRGPFSLDAAGAFAESFPGTEADRPLKPRRPALDRPARTRL